MNANPRTYFLSVCTSDGRPLFTPLIRREPSTVATPATAITTPAMRVAASHAPAGASNGEPRMTEPQRRYLFRLLAQQGLDGKTAEAQLKETFRVVTLREVSKIAASQLIEQMVADQKEVTHGRA